MNPDLRLNWLSLSISPRLKRMTHLSRQAMGVGMRGPGEKQLEVDRLAQKRIHDLKEELSKVEEDASVRWEQETISRQSPWWDTPTRARAH